MASISTYVGDGARNIFVASTQAGVATSTALSTTQTGLTLSNPFGSGKTLVVLRVMGAFTTAPAGAATLVLAANVNPNATAVVQTTPLTVRAANLGVTKAATGLAASAVTLPAAPVVVAGLGGPNGASSISQPQVDVSFGGALCVAPGCAVSLNSLTTAVSGVWTIIWEEISEIA